MLIQLVVICPESAARMMFFSIFFFRDHTTLFLKWSVSKPHSLFAGFSLLNCPDTKCGKVLVVLTIHVQIRKSQHAKH